MRKSVSDYPLVILALLLSAYGIAIVYSAGQTDFPVPYIVGAWKRQLGWFVLSLVGGYVAVPRSVRLVDWMTVPLYWIGIGLLVVTLVVRVGRGHGRQCEGLAHDRWSAHRAAVRAREADRRADARARAGRTERSAEVAARSLEAGAVVGLPWLLIMAQPDLGTGIVFIGIFFALLFWSGVVVAVARADRESGGEPDSRVQHRSLGRVVPDSHRARALLSAVHCRGRGRSCWRTSRWA